MSEMMRIEKLVGRKVCDSSGRRIGHVDEIRLRRVHTDYEVESLIIGVSGLLQRFGVVMALTRFERLIPVRIGPERSLLVKWEQIEDCRGPVIKLKVERERLEQYEPVPEAFD